MGREDDKLSALIAEERPLEHDPAWFGVNVSNRPVRDVLFGLIFVVNVGLVCAVSFYAFAVGQPTSSTTECQVVNASSADYFNQAIIFLETHANVLGISAGIALAFGVVWLLLLRLFTKIGIYVTLAVCVGVVIAGGVYLVRLDNEDIQIAGYVLFAIAALMLVVIFFLRQKIALTAACMSEACKALQHNPSTVVVAFITLALATCFVGMWIAAIVRLNCVPSIQSDPHRLRYLFIFFVFGGSWVVLFLIASLRTAVAGGVAVWYFGRSQYVHQDMPTFPTLTALGWSLSTSFGTMAFGSFILALIATIRFILYRAQKAAGANRVAAVILGCLRCCCACIFSLVQSLSEFAYVYVAMYGTGFIDSAQKVFALIGRQPLSIVMVETLTGVMLLFGRILGTLVCILSVMSILHEEISLHMQLSWTIVLAGIVAFIVLTVFSNVISCAVDTVFICYCEDLERNRESGRYLMDPDLHQTLQDAGNRLAQRKTGEHAV